jgi:hypothetical protein
VGLAAQAREITRPLRGITGAIAVDAAFQPPITHRRPAMKKPMFALYVARGDLSTDLLAAVDGGAETAVDDSAQKKQEEDLDGLRRLLETGQGGISRPPV